MKKLFSILLISLFVLSSIFSQPAIEEASAEKIRVAALKGPTAMGLVKLMESDEYSFTLEGSPDAIVPLLAKGEIDIAAIPANLAAILFNNTKSVKVIAVNTLGVLYLVGNNSLELKTREDFLGKTIYSAGKGSTPQYALETVLSSLGLEIGKDVYIEWKSEHAECVASLLSKEDAIAMLPQPFLTSALMQNPNLAVLADLNEMWESISSTPLVTGCAVVRTEFLENHPTALKEFLDDYEDSVNWVNDNIDESSKLIEKYGIIKANIASKALPYCNIVCLRDSEMREALEVYYNALFNINPKSVGGCIPSEEFYF